jgi:hypothetical protein
MGYNTVLLPPKSVLPRPGLSHRPRRRGRDRVRCHALMFDPADPDRPVKAFLPEDHP